MAQTAPSPESAAPAAEETKGPGLGTFAGVFTPSILTIFGIILFLRLGYVVGSSGLWDALLVIAIANAISVLTSLSVAAISTNLKVKGGGDYYLISRTLGVAYGGAIGLVLFLAQSISVGFYCIGFAEAVAAMFGQDSTLLVQAIAGVAVLGMFALAWLGADYATRFQFIVMGAIGLALTSFIASAIMHWDGHLLVANWSRPEGAIPLWAAFAVFFPAVTGFTQGVSMSGDLANPSRSIPMGVLTAVALSAVVYVGCAVLFAANVPGDILRADYTSMKRVAYFAPVVDAGVVAATLSSALASFLGAPRILQSLAGDKIFKMFNFFAMGEGPMNNPRRAVLLTLAIAAGVVILGDLNVIASLVSMFFLISYGLLNYATYMEARSESPSFRPTFKLYHPRIGLLGAIVCGLAMFEIDQFAGAAAIAIMFGVYQYVEKRAIPARFFDSRRSHHLYEARQHLLAASEEAEHPLSWRPQLLVLSDDRSRRQRLLRFASWIGGRSGLTTVARIVTGHGPEVLERRRQALSELKEEIEDSGVTAFPLVVVGDSLDPTLSALVQSAGIGPLRVNTVVVNWITNVASSVHTSLGLRRFSDNLRTAFHFGCNLLIFDADAREWEALDAAKPKDRQIDIWWHQNSSGELMLLLAHLMRRDDQWAAAELRVLTETNPGESEDMAERRLETALAEYRIDAEIIVCRFHKQEIVKRSSTASLVFLPFSIGDGQFYGPAGANMTEFLEYMPAVVLVMAAQDVALSAPRDSESHEEEETSSDEPDTELPTENQS